MDRWRIGDHSYVDGDLAGKQRVNIRKVTKLKVVSVTTLVK